MQIVLSAAGVVLGTYSWCDGFKATKQPTRRFSEREAEVHALWLERHVSSDAAIEFIDRWASPNGQRGIYSSP